MENDRKLVAMLAQELYEGKVTFDEFLTRAPENDTDEDISELIDLIVHEPKRGGFMGISPEEYDKYLNEIKKRIAKLSK